MKWLLLLLLLPLALAAGAILLNRPPLLEPPGLWPRLKLYLTTNVAETRPGHPRPELRPRVYALPAEALQAHVQAAMTELAWDEIRVLDGGLQATVRSPLLSFKDDVEVRLEPVDAGVRLGVRSASRVGRGDFGANTRHVMALYEALERRL